MFAGIAGDKQRIHANSADCSIVPVFLSAVLANDFSLHRLLKLGNGEVGCHSRDGQEYSPGIKQDDDKRQKRFYNEED